MTPKPEDDPDQPLRWWLRHYIRGLLLLVALALVMRFGASIWPAEAAQAFWAWSSAGTDRWALSIAIALLVPSLIGWIAQAWLRPFFLRRRELRALLSFETGAELASVFLPRGPDVRKGDIRIVPHENVVVTDWTLRELIAFQWSFGAAIPDSDEP